MLSISVDGSGAALKLSISLKRKSSSSVDRMEKPPGATSFAILKESPLARGAKTYYEPSFFFAVAMDVGESNSSSSESVTQSENQKLQP